ncbi:unnamed protein product [Linum tenue]|uniref:RNase H type-1 domain-containing protein n=1 Tax=Linum tenue TaxID=586396 RepID=A0AAV0QYQ6_9ROSI|nr:unnamed protein product [Linum tenue]
MLIAWQPPPTGWSCLNTDGSVLYSQGSSTAGGVIRREDGRLIRAFTANLGGGSITRAELMGICIGLRIAWEEGVRKVEVHSDSKAALALIQSAPEGSSHYNRVVQICRLIVREWQINLKHVFREANVVADHLASLGHSLGNGEHLIHATTPSLSHLLLHDVLGIQSSRLVLS